MRTCTAKALSLMAELSPAVRKAREWEAAQDQEFDQLYGTDTCGWVYAPRSEVVGKNWIYGVRYQAISTELCARSLAELSIRCEDFVFVDFGSGKGRAVLLATGYPFRRIVGVEYCDDLIDIARQNLARFPASARKCTQVEFVCADATEHPLPLDPLVLFFYNPFGRPVMAQVVRNVTESFAFRPRRILVIYMTPEYADLWDGVSFLKRRTSDIAMWDTGEVS